MIRISILAILPATALLCACNGGGNGLVGTPPTGGGNKAALEELQNQTAGLNRSTSVPITGGATYNGYVNMAPDGQVLSSLRGEVVGVAALDVSFANGGAMNGTVNQFDDEAGGQYSGELVVSNGSLGAGQYGPEISGDIAGTLVRDSGESYDIAGGLTGGFFGDNQEAINGFDQVTVTSGGQSVVLDIAVLGVQ